MAAEPILRSGPTDHQPREPRRTHVAWRTRRAVGASAVVTTAVLVAGFALTGPAGSQVVVDDGVAATTSPSATTPTTTAPRVGSSSSGSRGRSSTTTPATTAPAPATPAPHTKTHAS